MAIIAISEGERTTLFPEPVGRWVACRRKERTGTRILRSCAAFHFVFATRNIVTLFEKVVVSGISGAAVGAIAGKSRAGAAGAVFNQVAGVFGNEVSKFRRIFETWRLRSGAKTEPGPSEHSKNARTLGFHPNPRRECCPRPRIGPGEPPVHMAVRDMRGCGARRFWAYRLLGDYLISLYIFLRIGCQMAGLSPTRRSGSGHMGGGVPR